MKTVHTDVLVIGTGFGAAAPALRLAQAGARVVMIEKGPKVQTADFRQTSDPKYILKYLKGIPGDHLHLTYAEALGGGSGFYEMVSLRAPTLAFEQLDAGRLLWPAGVDRRALDPYYDLAERMLHVSQIPLEEVPKTGLVFARMMKQLGYSVDRCRYAVRGCQGSGFCVTGCVYGAKQSLFLNYLPQAVAAGAEVETDVEALAIQPLPARWREGTALADLPYRYRVTARRRADGALVVYVARTVVLGGGTVGTARLLAASRPHLPHLSEHVGRNIAYNGSVKVAALLPEGAPDGDMFTGRTHPGMVSYQFLASHGITVHAVKALPLMLVSAAHLRVGGGAFWGAANVELMRQLRHRVIILDAFGLTPPGAALETAAGDTRVSLPLGARLRAYHAATKGVLESILVRGGCRLIDTEFLDASFLPRQDIHFTTAHQVGSCRMADSRDRGVVDASGEVFGYPGLYVSDGAAIPSSLAVNTSLTILANAERIAAGMLERYRLRPGALAA